MSGCKVRGKEQALLREHRFLAGMLRMIGDYDTYGLIAERASVTPHVLGNRGGSAKNTEQADGSFHGNSPMRGGE